MGGAVAVFSGTLSRSRSETLPSLPPSRSLSLLRATNKRGWVVPSCHDASKASWRKKKKKKRQVAHAQAKGAAGSTRERNCLRDSTHDLWLLEIQSLGSFAFAKLHVASTAVKQRVSSLLFFFFLKRNRVSSLISHRGSIGEHHV